MDYARKENRLNWFIQMSRGSKNFSQVASCGFDCQKLKIQAATWLVAEAVGCGI